jgi:hypothetical protein
VRPRRHDRALLCGPSNSPLGALDRIGHVISSLGVAVRLHWAWLFRVRQTPEDGRATGMRHCPNDLPVFRSQQYFARRAGSGAHRYSILRQNVTARLTIVGGDRERLVVTRRGRGKTACAHGADRALLGAPSTSPLAGCLRSAGVTFSEIAIPRKRPGRRSRHDRNNCRTVTTDES